MLALACSSTASGFVRGQTSPGTEQTPVRVYKSTDGVSAPVLVPPNFTINAPADCLNPVSGTVTLAAVVDPAGQPRNIQFVRPLGNDLDRLAVKIAGADHFSPAMHENAAVLTGVSVEVTLEACNVAVQDAQGKEKHQLQLRAQPTQTVSSYDRFPDNVIYAPPDEDLIANPPRIYRVAGDVSMPIAFVPQQPISIGNGQGKAKYQGVVLISLVVDSHGLPQNLRVVRPLGMGLDQKAVDAVTNYRFTPALRHHVQPVPVMITVEVNFRINCDIRATGCLN